METEDKSIKSGSKSTKRWLPKFATKNKVLAYAVSSIVGLLIVAGGIYGYIYISTPAHIRKPSFQHYHFRTQIIVNGKSVDFSKEAFQVPTGASTTCSAEVGSTPIDFHDKMGQLTHVHWNGMTGGEFLKDFGWNYIGGKDGVLGQRYDNGLKPSTVKIYGKLLPEVPEESDLYVYVGDKGQYQQKEWNDFLNQDIETFFGKKSPIGHSTEVSFNISDWLFPAVYAHGEVMDEHASNKSEEELTLINNVIGNVVIFAQKDKPTDKQIKERFNNLVPLHESSCGD